MMEPTLVMKKGYLYLVVLENGRRFSGEFVDWDSQHRLIMRNSHGLVTFHRLGTVSLIKELGA